MFYDVFKKNIEKCPFTYLQLLVKWEVEMRLEILKSVPSL